MPRAVLPCRAWGIIFLATKIHLDVVEESWDCLRMQCSVSFRGGPLGFGDKVT